MCVFICTCISTFIYFYWKSLKDVLRFNEKILITTPYPGLFQLEINLNPAIVHDQELYNFGMHSKWRSGSKWEEVMYRDDHDYAFFLFLFIFFK